MKLSSKSGLVKLKLDIKPMNYMEFGDHEEIVQVGARFIDTNDEQYTIPKINDSVKSHKEVNRFDGHKIFFGRDTLDDIAIHDNEKIEKPVVIKSSVKDFAVSDWSVNELEGSFDFSDDEGSYKESDSEYQNTARKENNEPSIQELKGISKEIIENAKREAQEILDAAMVESKRIQDEAYRQGYQNGFAEVNSEIETLRTIQKNLLQLNDEIVRGSETKVIELIKLITEKVFSNGLALDPNILKDVVARAINEASRLGNLKVYLNPEDLEKLRKLWREAELDYNGQKIQLASNNEILPGGCFIDGDFGTVDARINTQVKSVLEIMTEIQLDQVEE